MEKSVHSYYGNRLRVRTCGVCITNEKLLMVNHSGITEGNFWAPPGGGIQLNESATDCLKRELAEETGLTVDIKKFLFTCELIREPLHSIELFFLVSPTAGLIKTGNDPEPGSPSIIQDVKYMAWDEIASIPSNQIHGIFHQVDHPSKIISLYGYFKL